MLPNVANHDPPPLSVDVEVDAPVPSATVDMRSKQYETAIWQGPLVVLPKLLLCCVGNIRLVTRKLPELVIYCLIERSGGELIR